MKKSALLASCANVLCLIHCIGFVALGAISPLFLVWLEHLWWLDGLVVVINLVFGNLSMYHMRTSKVSVVTYNLLISLALFTVIKHHHQVFHYLVLAMALMQIYLIFIHHKKAKSKDCCDHQHK